MDIKRTLSIMILLVFFNLTNYAQESSYIKNNNNPIHNLFINLGVGYSWLGTLPDNTLFDPENCLGYNIGIEFNKTINEHLYWGIETKFEYIPTKFSKDIAEIDPVSFTGNMDVNYTYINVIPKIGVRWKQPEPTIFSIIYWELLLFNYAEFNLGLGRAFYNIDQLFSNETENNQNYFNDSELLHSLNSEFSITTGIRLGRKISERISLSILLQGSVGLEQSKHYEGEWIYLGTDKYWSDSHTNRMTVGSVAFCLTYRPF
jgi:hypothetical protein